MAISGDDEAAPVRAVRPEPARGKPDRAGWGGTGGHPPPPPPPPPPPRPPSPKPEDGDIPAIVADAVRVGYDVIEANLRQGRAAADRYSEGHYRVEDASNDLAILGRRLLQLSRDLSTTGFDLIGAVLRDPDLRDAVARKAAPLPPPPPPARARQRAGPAVVSFVFRGPGAARASGDPTTLAHPETPAIPSLAALVASDPALPPITRIAFAAATLGDGVVVHVTIPEGQPAGVYTGVIVDAAGGKPLGTLTVRIA